MQILAPSGLKSAKQCCSATNRFFVDSTTSPYFEPQVNWDEEELSLSKRSVITTAFALQHTSPNIYGQFKDFLRFVLRIFKDYMKNCISRSKIRSVTSCTEF